MLLIKTFLHKLPHLASNLKLNERKERRVPSRNATPLGTRSLPVLALRKYCINVVSVALRQKGREKRKSFTNLFIDCYYKDLGMKYHRKSEAQARAARNPMLPCRGGCACDPRVWARSSAPRFTALRQPAAPALY